jgi:hypothetical protein
MHQHTKARIGKFMDLEPSTTNFDFACFELIQIQTQIKLAQNNVDISRNNHGPSTFRNMQVLEQSLVILYRQQTGYRKTILFNYFQAEDVRIIIIITTISFMQGIYTYIPETNNVPKENNVAAILSLLFMVPISLVPVLTL